MSRRSISLKSRMIKEPVVHHSKIGPPMSALGQSCPANAANGFPDVRFASESGQIADISARPLCAISGHLHRSKKVRYSRAVRQKEARHAVTARSTPVHYSG